MNDNNEKFIIRRLTVSTMQERVSIIVSPISIVVLLLLAAYFFIMIGELTYIIIVISLGLMVIGLTIVLIYSIKLLKQKNQNNSNSAPAITYMGDEILSICNFDGVTKSIKISDIKHITIETDGGLIRQAYDNIGFVVQGTCGEEKIVVKYVAYPSQAIAKLDKLIGN